MNNLYFIGLAVAVLSCFIFTTSLFWQFRKYQKAQRELLRGENGEALEQIVLQHKKTLANHHKNLEELGKILDGLVENNKFNIQKVGFVRFNPFSEGGGNMSFVLALLDGKNNGIVISSLHGREDTRIYAKNIERGKSQYRLTEEEQQAIQRANILKIKGSQNE